MKFVFIPILFLLLFTQPASAQTESISSIRITSSWDGFGLASKSELLVKQKKRNFSGEGVTISAEQAANLLKALDLSDKQLTPSDFGITREWLAANAEKALQEHSGIDTQTEKDLFIKSFCDLQLIERVYLRLLRGGWTDDYPGFEMEIVKKDGSRIKVSSDRQNVFMIPWTVEKSGRVQAVSDPALSRAIASLLPEKFTNKERIGGVKLLLELTNIVTREMRYGPVPDNYTKVGF